LAPDSSGEVEPSGSEPAGMRLFVKVTDAVSPSTLGALSASTTAWLSGLAAGVGLLSDSAPCAMPALTPSRAMTPTKINRRRVEMVRSRFIGFLPRRCLPVF